MTCSRRSPSTLKLHERAEPSGVLLSLWPNRLYALPVAIFTFLWLRFLWRWSALIFLASADDARGFLLVFGLPFLLAGVSLIATSVRLLTGRSIVSLDALRLRAGDRSAGGALRLLLSGSPAPEVVAPTTSIVDFVAECAVGTGDEDHELDAWMVRARLRDGTSLTLPLPVRTLAEASLVADRLNRGLTRARTPGGYRDSLPS